MQKKRKKKSTGLPPGWDARRVRKVLEHYERKTEEEAAREDEVAFGQPAYTTMKVPRKLVPVVRRLIASLKE